MRELRQREVTRQQEARMDRAISHCTRGCLWASGSPGWAPHLGSPMPATHTSVMRDFWVMAGWHHALCHTTLCLKRVLQPKQSVKRKTSNHIENGMFQNIIDIMALF